ncbi:MAG: DUF4968 domain-containing protein [Ignavibacteria bacterium]|nr:DUF4968 domain-containing protein [Ignavibacteria bacterium]
MTHRCLVRALPFLPLLMLFAASTSVAQTAVSLGAYVSHRVAADGVEITGANASVRVRAYGDASVRVRISREGFSKRISYAVSASPKGTFARVQDDADRLVLTLPALTVRIAKRPLRFAFFNADGKEINADDAGLGVSWLGSEVTRHVALLEGERFLGLGEKTGPLDRRGRSYVHWNSDVPAYGVEDDPLYASIPFYIGVHDSLAYGIFFDNTRRTRFDFGASSDGRMAWYSAPDGEMDYYVFGGPTVARVIEQYTSLTGRMPMPPLWSLGYQQCRYSYYPDTEVLNIARTFREKKIPCDVIYLDIHYMDAYKIFTWHPDRFPDPKRLIDSLRAMHFRVVTIVDPGIKVEDGYFAYEEGKKNGFFARYPGGDFYTGNVWPGRCHFPDFTSARVRDWWGASLARLTGPGVEGFWNDMNEPAVWGQSIPDAVQFSFEGDTATMREAHNIYGMQMARATYEGARKLLGRRPFVLTRAGYAGLQRSTAIWTGDNFASDEHMLLATRLVSSLGLSGVPFSGPDIGGFIGDAGRDLFSRWMTIGTYTPLFRNHKVYGARRQEPWSLGEDVETLCRQTLEQRYRLLPYIYSTFDEASRTGMPVARSLAIDWSFDPKIYDWNFHNQYLFGPGLLVAPVSSAVSLARVYLPTNPGGWYRLHDDTRYAGGQEIVVDAPVYELPVFARAGAVLPMQRSLQHSGERADTLELHVYAGGGGYRTVYYEDDGLGFDNERGVFHRRTITFRDGILAMEAAQGSFRSARKALRFVLHGFETAPAIAINGTAASCSLVQGWTRPRFETSCPYMPERLELRITSAR